MEFTFKVENYYPYESRIFVVYTPTDDTYEPLGVWVYISPDFTEQQIVDAINLNAPIHKWTSLKSDVALGMEGLVGAGAYVAPVVEPEIVKPEYDPLMQQLVGPDEGIYTIVDRDLEDIKADVKEMIAAARHTKETGMVDIVIQGQDLQVSAARDDRNIWFQSSVLLPEGSTQKFKFSSDIWLDLSKIEIEAVVQAIMFHVQSSFAWEFNKLSALDAVTDSAGIQDLINDIAPVVE